MESVQVPLLSSSSPTASPQGRPKPEHKAFTGVQRISRDMDSESEETDDTGIVFIDDLDDPMPSMSGIAPASSKGSSTGDIVASEKNGSKTSMEEDVVTVIEGIKKPEQPTSSNEDEFSRFGHPLLHGVLDKNKAEYLRLLERMLIIKNFNINVKDPRSGNTPLHAAASKGKDDILSLLLERGADCNAVNRKGQTPLHLSIQNGHDDCSFKLLSQKDIKVYLPDEELNTTFHVAVKEGRENICQAILARYDGGGTKVFVTDCKNIKGKTPLHYAAGRNLKATVKLLLDNGADPKKSDKYEYLPLHYASEKGYDECCKLLLNSMSKDVVERQLTTYTKTGKTPLMLAAEGGYRKCCEIMKVGINKRDLKKENTALHLAVRGGFQNTVKQLLDDGANPNIRNKRGSTPVHEAAEFNKLECLQYLVQEGANVREINGEGKNIFHLAAEKKGKDMLEYLLNKPSLHKTLPVVLNEKDRSNNTPLHLSIMSRSEDTALLLIERGSSPAEEASDGKTCLHLAALHRCLSLCVVLISKYRIPVNKENKRKETALHLAAQSGSDTVCRFLMKKGAHADAKDCNGRTALHIAAENDNANVLRVLIKEGASPEEPDGLDGSYPLHLAAAAGSLECCKILVNRARYVSWKEDENRKLPLDRAFQKGNPNGCKESQAKYDEVFDYLLRNLPYKENQETPMLHIYGYMKDAIKNDRTVIIKAIIDSSWWEAGIVGKNGYQCQNFRELIRSYPDLASELMKRCIFNDKINKEVTYDFSVFEDNYYVGSPSEELAEDPFDPDTEKLLPDAMSYDKGHRWKENHPVHIMIKNKRNELLHHPLTKRWLKLKWKTLAKWLYFFYLLIQLLFTLILGLFMGLVKNWRSFQMDKECFYPERRFCELAHQQLALRYEYRYDDNEYSSPYGPYRSGMYDGDMILFNNCTRYSSLHLFLWSMLLIFTIITIVVEINNLYRLRSGYFKIRDHYFQIAKVIFTILLLIPWSSCEFHFVVLNDFRWDVGIIALLLAGFHLIFALNQVPCLTVFMPMTCTFLLSFLLVWLYIAVIIFIFAFIFHLLLKDQLPFMYIPQAMVKTTVWMLGDLAYDDTFLDEHHRLHRPFLTNVLFVLFVTILGSLLANFIITSPSKQLDKYRDNAVFYRAANRAQLIMNFLVCFPYFTRNKTVRRYIESSSQEPACCGRILPKKIRKFFPREVQNNPEMSQPHDAVYQQLHEMNNQLSASLIEIKSLKIQLTKLNQAQLELKNSISSPEITKKVFFTESA